MDSLERICLYSVARDASCYEVEDFKALNVYILQQLVSYLGAYQLNRLHEIFVEAGVDVQRVWKSHLALHWNSVCDFPTTVFNSDNVRGSGRESRRIYLERLFQKIIGNLDSGTDTPLYVINLKRLPRCRHGICFQCQDSTVLDNSVLRTELPQYAIHVRILSVSAASPVIPFLFIETNLLRILQGVVRRLDLHRVYSSNFPPARELVRLLVQEGSVSEFSLFNSCLYASLLVDLLRFVSGLLTVDCNGSLPVEQVKTELLLDDEESKSTGVKERRDLKGFEGCDDVPSTMVTINEGRNSTGPEETSQTLLQACEDSFSSDPSPDDDLYDIALTTSGSHANRCRSGLCPPIPGVHSSITSALHLGNSHSGLGMRNRGTVVSNSKTSAGDLDSPTHCSASPPRSCTSFTLGHYCGSDAHWVLFRLLRNWTTLQRLALFEITDDCSDMNKCPCHHLDYADFTSEDELVTSTKDSSTATEFEEIDEFKRFLYRSIQGGQLTHLVTHESILGVDFDQIVVCALHTRQNEYPMEEVTMILTPGKDTSRYLSYLPSTASTVNAPLFDPPFPEEDFLGTVCLHVYDSYITEAATSDLIMSWISKDRALRSLQLPYFWDPLYLTKALKILECNQGIVELHLDKHTFDSTSASSLVSVLHSCHLLSKLNLDECNLSKKLVDGKSFVEAITTHPSLTELSLKHNKLKDVGCDLLKAICLRKAFFNSLDLSFNRIEGKLLFDTCQEIQTVLRNQRRTRFPLSELYLSGNIFHLEWRNRLIETLLDCVDVFVAQDPNLGNPAGPLADHMSQM